MIQGDFHCSVGSESVRLSHGSFALSLNPSTVAAETAPGAEHVEQQGAMSPQCPCHFLHRLDLRTHGACAPSVQELPGPVRRDIIPEKLEVLANVHQLAGSQPRRQPIHFLNLACPVISRFYNIKSIMFAVRIHSSPAIPDQPDDFEVPKPATLKEYIARSGSLDLSRNTRQGWHHKLVDDSTLGLELGPLMPRIHRTAILDHMFLDTVPKRTVQQPFAAGATVTVDIPE